MAKKAGPCAVTAFKMSVVGQLQACGATRSCCRRGCVASRVPPTLPAASCAGQVQHESLCRERLREPATKPHPPRLANCENKPQTEKTRDSFSSGKTQLAMSSVPTQSSAEQPVRAAEVPRTTPALLRARHPCRLPAEPAPLGCWVLCFSLLAVASQPSRLQAALK